MITNKTALLLDDFINFNNVIFQLNLMSTYDVIQHLKFGAFDSDSFSKVSSLREHWLGLKNFPAMLTRRSTGADDPGQAK